MRTVEREPRTASCLGRKKKKNSSHSAGGTTSKKKKKNHKFQTWSHPFDAVLTAGHFNVQPLSHTYGWFSVSLVEFADFDNIQESIIQSGTARSPRHGGKDSALAPPAVCSLASSCEPAQGPPDGCSRVTSGYRCIIYKNVKSRDEFGGRPRGGVTRLMSHSLGYNSKFIRTYIIF